MTTPNFLQSSIYVAFGGAIGAWLRYLVGRTWMRAIGLIAATAFPWATLTVNFLGSFAMGVLAGWLARYGQGGEGWRLLLGVGVLGGFTTFSAFSLEIVDMANRGAFATAAIYISVSLAGGILGLFAGLLVMRVAA